MYLHLLKFWKTSRTTFEINAIIFVLLKINKHDDVLESAVTITSTVNNWHFPVDGANISRQNRNIIVSFRYWLLFADCKLTNTHSYSVEDITQISAEQMINILNCSWILFNRTG